MAAINTARDRAEEWLHNLQKRGRDLIDAEEGMVRTVRDLIDKQGLAPAEVRKRLETVVGSIKANKIWDRVKDSSNGAVGFINESRDNVEKRVEERVHRVLDSLQIATKADLDQLAKQLKTLNKKVSDLSKKIKED